jgi:hypothetical protein
MWAATMPESALFRRLRFSLSTVTEFAIVLRDHARLVLALFMVLQVSPAQRGQTTPALAATAIDPRSPQGIAVDSAGNLYVVGPSSPVVFKIAPTGAIIPAWSGWSRIQDKSFQTKDGSLGTSGKARITPEGEKAHVQNGQGNAVHIPNLFDHAFRNRDIPDR